MSKQPITVPHLCLHALLKLAEQVCQLNLNKDGHRRPTSSCCSKTNLQIQILLNWNRKWLFGWRVCGSGSGDRANAMVPLQPQPAIPCLQSQQETADDSKRKHLSLAMWVTETFLSAVRVFWTAAPLIHRRNQQEVITTVSLRRISLKCSGQRLWTITSCRIRTLQQIRAPTPLRSPAQHLQVRNCPRTPPGFVWLLLRV